MVEAITNRRVKDRRKKLIDGLTGLPMRDEMLDRVARLRARKTIQSLGIIFIDLDKFKAINDEHDHEGGNSLLAAVARRLKSLLEFGEEAFRPGGDEFVVVVPNPGDWDYLMERGYKLRMGIGDRPYLANLTPEAIKVVEELFGPEFDLRKLIDRTGKTRVDIQSTVGVNLWLRDQSTPPPKRSKKAAKLLVRGASRAVLMGKESSLHPTSLKVVRYRQVAWNRREIRNQTYKAVRHTIDRLDIGVHYQPIYDLSNQQLCGFEAFPSYEGAFKVTPDNMAEIYARLEREGHDEGLWRQALDKSCRQLQVWNDLVGHKGLVVSVNLAPSQIGTAAATAGAIQILTAHLIQPSQIAFEITEREKLLPRAGEDLLRLRELGFGVILDDLGNANATPKVLAEFINCWTGVKLDGELVGLVDKEPAFVAVVKSLIRLCDELPKLLPVTAEGIERTDQATILSELGCARGQGYLLGHKLSPEQASLLLQPDMKVEAGP